jgi:hypothetical protein
VAQLLPDGVQDVRDLPHTIFEAIRSALLIISFDELPENERPPRRIWNDAEQLNAFFEQLRKHRKQEAGAGGGPGPIEDPQENEAARLLIAE